jgi:hypothetical protein
MSTSRISLVALSAAAWMASGALAHDMVIPPWRGQDGTTYQEWRFDTGANPADPEVINNTYGTATAAITVSNPAFGWRDQLSGFGTQQGYWDLGYDGTMVIDIDNRPDPLPYKEVWVQVTYFRDIQEAPSVHVPGGQYISGQTLLVEQVSTGGAWYLDQSIWLMEPNPPHEQIEIIADPFQSVVDQVVIDTICAPEPGTSLLVLVAGGLMALRARRRR